MVALVVVVLSECGGRDQSLHAMRDDVVSIYLFHLHRYAGGRGVPMWELWLAGMRQEWRRIVAEGRQHCSSQPILALQPAAPLVHLVPA